MKKTAAIVSLVHLDNYDPKAVDEALVNVLAPLGGIEAFAKPGMKVVLKPNLLKPAVPSRAVTTHPEIIRGVARLVQQISPESVVVTDSSGLGSAVKCMKKLGLENGDEPFDIMDADDGVDYDTPGQSYHRLKLSRRMMEADLLINLPKVKTHGQMGLTLAVKNTFGAVVGFEKAQWHFRIGKRVEQFAKLVIDIHHIVNPGLHIVDGVIAMEGNGPGSGEPRPLRVLAAATHPHALDAVLTRLLGIPLQNVETLRVASRSGLLPDQKDIEIVGEPLSRFQLDRPWQPARPLTPTFIRSKRLAPVVDRVMSVKPHVNIHTCVMCGLCVRHCAAKAMEMVSSPPPVGSIKIDKDKCISCFCCQEMCPNGSITVKAGLVARLFRLGVR